MFVHNVMNIRTIGNRISYAAIKFLLWESKDRYHRVLSGSENTSFYFRGGCFLGFFPVKLSFG
jgi:hypothetical protein